MRDASYDVVVQEEVWDLIPTFMENRKKELATLRAAMTDRDFEQLRLVAHRLKGVGASYGFFLISALGKELEDSARVENLTSIAHTLDIYEDYLSKVRVSRA